MDRDDLHARGRSLEEAFFSHENERLRLALKAEAGVTPSELGIEHPDVLGHLRELDLSGDTVAALTLIPVVAVAWADGVLQDGERTALMSAAEATGIAPGTPSHKLLQAWLRERPDPELFERWKSFIVALCADMDVHAIERLRADLLHRARSVAEASGGLFGFARVSGREREILSEMEHAFPA